MATEDARKLFVAGLPESITEEVLKQLFEATGGSVVDVSLPKDRMTGRPRGFGFVTMASPEEANQARGALDGTIQAGRSISVRPFSSEPPKRGDARSEPPAPASEDRTLYVGNLPYDTTQQEVTELLSSVGVGPVVRMHLPNGPDGRPRGFGFVTLGSSEAANEAISALRDVEVRGRRLIVNVAHPRGERGSGGQHSERPRAPRAPEPGFGPSEPRFPTEPPMAFEAARGDRRVRPSPTEQEGSDESRRSAGNKKKRTRGTGKEERSPQARKRGGGSSWRSWDDDD